MKRIFYVKWENEYSEIKVAETMPEGLEFSGPFRTLSDAKKTLIPFLETKIEDTKENLKKIRSLSLEDFPEEEKDQDLL